MEDSRDRTGLPEPIELPGGVRLASLREAIVHLVNTIPSSERGIPVVLTAAELITSAAQRGGPIEFARIATLGRSMVMWSACSAHRAKTCIGAAGSWREISDESGRVSRL